jgi:hypothetical protein
MIDSTLAIIVLAFLGLMMTLAFLAILYFPLATFTSPSFHATFGSLFEGVKLHNSQKMYLMYNFLLLLRRLLFGLAVIYLDGYQMLQIQVFLISSIFNMIYLLYFRPLDGPAANRLEIFNESIVLITGYHMVLFSAMDPKELDPHFVQPESKPISMFAQVNEVPALENQPPLPGFM